MQKKTVLLVCMNNTCRSPMARAVAEALLKAAGLQRHWSVDSAGTHANHVGERIDGRARVALERRGYAAPSQRSRRIAAGDFARAELVLAMDQANLVELKRQCPPQLAGKLRLLLDFDASLRGQDIPDPYYGSAAGFERVLDLCEAGARGLLDTLSIEDGEAN